MNDHHHYGEYAEPRHDHRGEYADDRHDHDPDYAARYHSHHDLEREDERLKDLLGQWQADLAGLRTELTGALERIRVLEGSQQDTRPAARLSSSDMSLTDECERDWHERCPWNRPGSGVTCDCSCHADEIEEVPGDRN